MSRFYFRVYVDTDTPAHANQVMSERIGPDEQYTDEAGVEFDYTIDWTDDGFSTRMRSLIAATVQTYNDGSEQAFDRCIGMLENFLDEGVQK